MAGPTAASPHPSRRDVCDYELLFDCVHCGLCAEACPTYVATRREMDSPRGRIYLMKSLSDGALALDQDSVRHLDLCLGCRGCETACPSGVHYGELIEGARAFVERNYTRSLADRLKRALISAIFPHPARLRALLAPIFLLDRLGLRSALRAVMPRMVRDWIDLLPDKIKMNRSATSHQTNLAASAAPSVLLHHGCVAQVLADSENLNSEGLLSDAGYRIVRLQRTECCGALDLHMGNAARALEFARANVRAIKASGADAVVSAASGCSTTIAQYGELLKDDSELADDAREVAGKVSDLSSLLLARPQPRGGFRCTVTYHDACHLAHGLGVREAPRRLLESIAGVKLVELNESDLCCGSAGSYNLTEPAMSRDLARRKVDNILSTGAEYVVLANPGCEFQIAAELRRRGSAIKVMHIADFIAMAWNNRSP